MKNIDTSSLSNIKTLKQDVVFEDNNIVCCYWVTSNAMKWWKKYADQSPDRPKIYDLQKEH